MGITDTCRKTNKQRNKHPLEKWAKDMNKQFIEEIEITNKLFLNAQPH